MAMDSTQGITQAQLAKEIWGSAFGTSEENRIDKPGESRKADLICYMVMGIFFLAAAAGLAYLATFLKTCGGDAAFGTSAGLSGLIGLGIIVGVSGYMIYYYRKKLTRSEAFQWLEKQEGKLNQKNDSAWEPGYKSRKLELIKTAKSRYHANIN